MKPSIHIITSFSLAAAFWFFTRSVYASILCFASGVLVDFDHVIEYVIHFGRRDLNFDRIYQACRELLFRRLYLVFHSGELAVFFLFTATYMKNEYILAIALGYSLHLILDFIGNPLHPISYFMSRRIAAKFDTNALLKNNSPWKTKKS